MRYLTEVLFVTRTTVFYFIILLFVNIIFIIVNDLLVRHVSNCIDHLQVIVRRNDGFGCFFNYLATVGDVVCVLDYFVFSAGVILGLFF